MGMSISDQSQEIDRLNDRYRHALTSKLDLYPELQESVKELTVRDARFLVNELDSTLLKSETSIIKRELEQKERQLEDLWKEIADFSISSGQDDIPERINEVVNREITKLRQERKKQRDQENEREL